MFQNALQQASDLFKRITGGAQQVASQVGNYINAPITAPNIGTTRPDFSGYQNALQQAVQPIRNFYQQQIASPQGFFNPSSNIRSLSGQDLNPNYNNMDLLQKGAALVGNTLGAFAPVGAPPAVNLTFSPSRAVLGYGIGSALNYAGASPQDRSMRQAITPNENNLLFGLGTAIHPAVNRLYDLQDRILPSKFQSANLDIKSPAYEGYRDIISNSINNNIDKIHQSANTNPLAVNSYGILQKVADLIDKRKDTPADLRLAAETLNLHGINPVQEAQSGIKVPSNEKETVQEVQVVSKSRKKQPNQSELFVGMGKNNLLPEEISKNNTVSNQSEPIQSKNLSSPPSIPQTPPGQPPPPDFQTKLPKYAGSINLNRLNVSNQAKQNLNQLITDLKPDLQQIKGASVTHGEVLDAVDQAKLLNRVIPRDQTLQMEAAVTKLRMAVAAGAEGQGVSEDFIKNVRTLNSYATNAGRILNSFNIEADPSLPISPQVKQQIIGQLTKLGIDSQKIIDASQGVDFSNPNQVTSFYRQFVKPQTADLLREFRYINLLSSPATLSKITFSHIMQAAVLNPLTKLVSGGIDYVASNIQGSERQHYISEVPAYFRGALSNLGTAYQSFVDTVTGSKFGAVPNVQNLPTGDPLFNVGRMFTTNLHSGIYNFFQQFITAGEREALVTKLASQGKNMSPAMIDQIASQKGAYGTFRTPLDLNNKTGQGYLLSAIDHVTSGISKISRDFKIGDKTISNPINFFIPFMRIATDLMKKNIEYSPLGFATMKGAFNPTEQAAKATIGSMVMLGAAYLAHIGNGAASPPVTKKERALFYGSGRQPWSIQIGDKWISVNKLGVLSAPVALALAAKNYFEQNPKASVDSVTTKIAKTGMGFFQNISDASYLRGIGDMIKGLEGAAQGDTYYAKQSVANIGSQFIPLSSLVSWAARVVDPRVKQPENLLQTFQSHIPFLSQGVPALKQPFGENAIKQNYLINSLAPADVNQNNPIYDQLFNQHQVIRQNKAVIKANKDQIKKQSLQPNRQEQSNPFSGVMNYIQQLRQGMPAKLSYTPPVQDSLITASAAEPNKSTGKPDPYAVPTPEYTGNSTLDAKITAQYKTDVAGMQKNIMDAYKANAFSKDPQKNQQIAVQKIQNLINQQNVTPLIQPIPSPKLTGDDTIDQRLLQGFQTQVAQRGRQIMQALNSGSITQDQASQLLDEVNTNQTALKNLLKNYNSKGAGGGGGRTRHLRGPSFIRRPSIVRAPAAPKAPRGVSLRKATIKAPKIPVLSTAHFAVPYSTTRNNFKSSVPQVRY